ncbi:hypothetical protein FZEAL_7298 [Fusarium zealandicum]|uniref:Ankyrin repeat protein n=1 Tax=Fusarium zealandicum TaxID=1053134 RepID=A0A8H4UG93_9HYPO|nr:hypothetical protein FZEAL_7298 [Fusarium zealandicum]
MDPLSIVASVIAIIGAVNGTYKTLDNIRGLPKAFEEVKRSLPLVQNILQAIQDKLKSSQVGVAESRRDVVLAILEPCEHNATILRKIFEELEDKCNEDRTANTWKKACAWYFTALQHTKAHRVESLMNEVLRGVQKLAWNETFGLATSQDVENLKAAIEDLSEVQPSLEDSEFDNPGVNNGTQHVASNASGQQNNTQGGTHTFNTDNQLRQRRTHVLKSLYQCSYNDAKNRVRRRTNGTCEWFTEHHLFHAWRDSKESNLLLVTADPGCGKSVLARYLADHVLPQSSSRTSCFFFFKDDFEDQKSAPVALCCLLRQAFDQDRTLLSEEILDRFESDGDRLLNSSHDLWGILVEVASLSPTKIVCVVDALDECEKNEQLIGILSDWYTNEHTRGRLKVLITSRPHGKITRPFSRRRNNEMIIHLRGDAEEEVDKIEKEIDFVINERVEDLGDRRRLTSTEKEKLGSSLRENPNRTYLWVYLVLDVIENLVDTSEKALRTAVTTLPPTVDDAYEKILSRSHDKEKTRRLVRIILSAHKPLTVGEMQIALSIRQSHNSLSDLETELEPDYRFRVTIRDLCGLFVSVTDEKVYLIHQTAREFLEGDIQANYDQFNYSGRWKNSVDWLDGDRILACSCAHYILISGVTSTLNLPVFFEYSAGYWTRHLRFSFSRADEVPGESMEDFLELCDPKKSRCPSWLQTYIQHEDDSRLQGLLHTEDAPSRYPSALIIASILGIHAMVQQLLETESLDVNATDCAYRRTALSWACVMGDPSSVSRLLKKKDVDVNKEDADGNFPLHLVIGSFAYARYDGPRCVQRLLGSGRVDCNKPNRKGVLPFDLVATGHLDRTEYDLNESDRDVDSAVNEIDRHTWGAALKIVESGRLDVNRLNRHGKTPLHLTIAKTDANVAIEILDFYEVDINIKDNLGRSPLHLAIMWAEWQLEVLRRILKVDGLDVNYTGPKGRTPLMLACEYGKPESLDCLKVLLESGLFDPHAEDSEGYTLAALVIREGMVVRTIWAVDSGLVDLNWCHKETGKTLLDIARDETRQGNWNHREERTTAEQELARERIISALTSIRQDTSFDERQGIEDMGLEQRRHPRVRTRLVKLWDAITKCN